MKTALNYDDAFRVSEFASKHGPILPGVFYFLTYICICVYVETGTKLVLESRAPPFGRLWRSVMRGENVVGERGCYTIS